MKLKICHIYLLLAAQRHVTLVKYFKWTPELISVPTSICYVYNKHFFPRDICQDVMRKLL
jgi:hypothetical protein